MSADTPRIAATPQNQPLADISDDSLAALLATDPYVKVRGALVTIETQAEELPDAPETCPECGEPFEKRTFDRDHHDGTHVAKYHHHLSGFGNEWCTVESDWQPQKTITVEYARAKQVTAR